MTEFKVGDRVRLTGQMWGREAFPGEGDVVEVAGWDVGASAPYFRDGDGDEWYIWNDGDWDAELVERAWATGHSRGRDTEGVKELGVDPVEQGDRVKPVVELSDKSIQYIADSMKASTELGEVAKKLGIDPVQEGDFVETVEKLADDVNHPSHYTAYQGIEVIQLTEQMNFNRGNAVKYIARAGLKNPETEIQDLQKAAWYINREIERLGRE